MFECPVCENHTQATQHHVYPLRFFPQNLEENRHYCYLCRTCHDALEVLIQAEEKAKGGVRGKPLTRARYVSIVREFLDRAWEHA